MRTHPCWRSLLTAGDCRRTVPVATKELNSRLGQVPNTTPSQVLLCCLCMHEIRTLREMLPSRASTRHVHTRSVRQASYISLFHSTYFSDRLIVGGRTNCGSGTSPCRAGIVSAPPTVHYTSRRRPHHTSLRRHLLEPSRC